MNPFVERLRQAPPRSWLFVPALRAPEWLPKAFASGADVVIVDLEDATAPEEKDRAREVVRQLQLREARGDAFVRVNASTDRLHADLRAAVEAGAHGVVLPKMQDGAEVVDVARSIADGGLAIMPIVETARGVLNAAAIAAADECVCALGFGGEDLCADTGAVRTVEGTELIVARGMVVLAAAAAGVGAVDTPWLDLADHEGAGREAAAARALGFAGKLLIHPAQVRPVHAAFTPSASEVRHASAVVLAAEEAERAGSGVAVHEGRMIDRPVLLAARRVLARAELKREATVANGSSPGRSG